MSDTQAQIQTLLRQIQALQAENAQERAEPFQSLTHQVQTRSHDILGEDKVTINPNNGQVLSREPNVIGTTRIGDFFHTSETNISEKLNEYLSHLFATVEDLNPSKLKSDIAEYLQEGYVSKQEFLQLFNRVQNLELIATQRLNDSKADVPQHAS